MKELEVIKYQCSYCGKTFDYRADCRHHEKDKHECPECKHSYYVYGCEFRCAQEEAGKKCRFVKRKEN